MSTVTRWLLSGAGIAAAVNPATALQEEALDSEFLDYLDSLEGEHEDWTWFGDKEESSAGEDEATVEGKNR